MSCVKVLGGNHWQQTAWNGWGATGLHWQTAPKEVTHYGPWTFHLLASGI